MTNEEASIIVGNMPINGDECYSISEYQQAKAMAIKALEEPKTGHWIYELEDWNKWTCSECGWSMRTDVHVKLGYKYCPNCGARMEGENE